MGEPPPSPARSASLKLSDSMCAPQYTASLKCLDEANYDKSKCQDYFDAYKECKKQEVAVIENYALKPTVNPKGFFEVPPSVTEQNRGLLSLMAAVLAAGSVQAEALFNGAQSRLQKHIAPPLN